MSNFNFQPLVDKRYYLEVPANVMETYVRYIESKLNVDASGVPLMSHEQLYTHVSNHLRTMNQYMLQGHFEKHGPNAPLDSLKVSALRRSSLEPIAAQRSLMDFVKNYGDQNLVRTEFIDHEILDASQSSKDRSLRMTRTLSELESIYANRFGAASDFPAAYRDLLSNYMTETDLRDLERSWSADSSENYELTQKQARRAYDVLETLEDQFRGMYRVRLGNDSSELRAEMIDLPGTKVVLLPSRSIRGTGRETAEQAAIRNVGTVLMNDNIYALAEPTSETKYGRYADSQPSERVPGQVVMEAMLLNTVDSRGNLRIARNAEPDREGVTRVSAASIRPNEQVTNAMLAVRNRTRPNGMKFNDRTINETIRAGISTAKTAATFAINYKYRAGDPRQNGVNPLQNASIIAMPQKPVNAIAATGEDRLRAIDASIREAARAEDVENQVSRVGVIEDLQESDLDSLFTDDLGVADFSENLGDRDAEGVELEVSDIEDSAPTVMGQTRRDELIELRARMDFNASDENPIRVVNLNRDVWYGSKDQVPEGSENFRLTPMEEYIVEDLNRMGVSPQEIRSNSKGSYQIDVPELFGGKQVGPDKFNTIHLALGQLNNYSRELGGYKIQYNNVTKGVFIPGYRLTIDRHTGGLQVVEFSDIVREAFHASIVSQLTNPSAANDTIDPYLALDKVITTYGYGTLFRDMDPNNINDMQRINIQQARHKARFMTTIADSASMFNVIKDDVGAETNNMRLRFSNTETIRVPNLAFEHLIDRTKSSQDGKTVFLGVDTKIDAQGRLYSDIVPPLTQLTNKEALADPNLSNLTVNAYPRAMSPLTLAYPSTLYDEYSRQCAVASQTARIGAPNSVTEANMAYTTSGGFGIGDGFVISKAFAESIGLHIKHGQTRELIVGDKLSDIHGDKGLIVMVVDPDSPDPKLNHLKAIMAGNPDLDIIAPFGTLLSRGTGGVAREMQDGYIRQLSNVESDGKVIPLENVSLSKMSLILSDMNATYKTNVYTRDAYNTSNRGRSASTQLNAALTALGAKTTLSHIYADGTYNGQDIAHARLISDMNVLGYDIDSNGVLGQINTTALLQDEGTVIIDPREHINFDDLATSTHNGRFGVKFSDALSKAARITNAKRVAIDIGENVRLNSGVTTQGIDSQGRSRNVIFMPIAYLTQLNAMGREQQSLIVKDAYRNRLKTIYDYVAGTGKRDRSMSELVNRLSSAVISRSFAKKDNVVKSNIYRVAMSESSTSVITADPTLPLDTVRISKEYWESIGSPDPEANERILCWRDPILRPTNVAGYKFIVDENITGVALNPLLADKMDGDFDGDTFGTVYSKDRDVQNEWATLLSAENTAQLYRLDAEGNEVSMLDINGDVKLPYLVRQDKALNQIADALVSKDFDQLNTLIALRDMDSELAGEPSELHYALDALAYDLTELRVDSPELTDVEFRNMVMDDITSYKDVLFDNANFKELVRDSGIFDKEALTVYDEAAKALHDMDSADLSYSELHEVLFDNGLDTPEAYGSFGLDVRDRDHIIESITKPVDMGYSSKRDSIDKFMMHYDNQQTVADYLDGAAGNGYKSDFVGIPGSLQQILIARLRGTNEGDISGIKTDSTFDKSTYIDDTQRAMRAALQLTWIATDGTLQAKKSPENGRLIQELASNDLKNLVKGYPRQFMASSRNPEPMVRMTTDEWIKEMTEVLTNPNHKPDNWDELHPNELFSPGLNAGEMLDINDITVIGQALSDDNGKIRFVSDDFEQGRISAFDAICYGSALLGASNPTAGLEAAFKYGLSTRGNDYQNVFVPSDINMWAPSVITVDSMATTTDRVKDEVTYQPVETETVGIKDVASDFESDVNQDPHDVGHTDFGM